jgi:hypothetical protein
LNAARIHFSSNGDTQKTTNQALVGVAVVTISAYQIANYCEVVSMRMFILIAAAIMIVSIAQVFHWSRSAGGADVVDRSAELITPTTGPTTFKMSIWADNWYAFSLGDAPIIEDSVPITTERSFNAETFEFKSAYPLTLNLIVKDFKENDTGLEYIGSKRQQLGDGGFIAQLEDLTQQQTVAVTSADWRCLVVHRAPLDQACVNNDKPVAGEGACTFEAAAEPAGWRQPQFDDSGWPKAVEHSAASVRPKDGYDKISWDGSAKLIWSEDLAQDNTLLCRLTVTAPN